MNHKPNAFYDEKLEECMYPLPNESEAAFQKRLEVLRNKRDASMTDKEKELARLFSEGKVTPDMLEIVNDD